MRLAHWVPYGVLRTCIRIVRVHIPTCVVGPTEKTVLIYASDFSSNYRSSFWFFGGKRKRKKEKKNFEIHRFISDQNNNNNGAIIFHIHIISPFLSCSHKSGAEPFKKNWGIPLYYFPPLPHYLGFHKLTFFCFFETLHT